MTELLNRPDQVAPAVRVSLAPPATAAPVRPVATRLPGATVEAVSQVLTRHGIGHGALVEGPPTLNHTLSDGSRVFCKVSRPGDVSPRPLFELAGTKLAAAAGMAANTALIDAPVEVVDEHGVRLVSVWRHEEACAAPSLVDQARLVAEVASIPPQADVDTTQAHTFNLGFFLERIERRLSPMVVQGDEIAARILGRARDCYAQTAAVMEPDRFRWTHSDAHLKNVIWQVSGSPMLIDWESHCVGPVEWDIAAVVRSCFQDFPEHDISTRAEAARAAVETFASLVDFDPALVLLSVTARGVSYQSHLHAVGHHPVMLERTYDLDDLVSSGFIAALLG